MPWCRGWRRVRWLALALAAPALWACTSHRLVPSPSQRSGVEQRRITERVTAKLDLLFVVDNSLSMEPLQTKMLARLPDFMEVLQNAPGGLPDLHVAVVSTSMGSGAATNVARCELSQDGKFHFAARPARDATTCPVPMNGAHFIRVGANGSNIGAPSNIATVFQCIAFLGDQGCGFEQPLESMMRALQKAGDPNDPDNAGFLRPDASLAIVIIANEDDCSVPPESILFDPNDVTLASPLGGYHSYRCAEFGHLCGGAPPPRPAALETSPLVLDPGPERKNCESNEAFADRTRSLYPLSRYTGFLKSLKPDPNRVFVAVIGGPPVPYAIEMRVPMTVGTELQPHLVPSCRQGAEYADPSPRLMQFVKAFGANGVFQTICASDFRPSMVKIAEAITRSLPAPCIGANYNFRTDAPAIPDCVVTDERTSNAEADGDADAGLAGDKLIPYCSNTGLPGTARLSSASHAKPCWRVANNPVACPATDPASSKPAEVQICYDPLCLPGSQAQILAGHFLISCAVTF